MQKLSIIIPTLNESPHILDTLGDLVAIRATGHEIIVVDGGSSDATIELASEYADHVISSPKGRARQMNAGANKASGDVLWFLHADTRVSEQALAALKSALHSEIKWGRFNVRLSGRQSVLRLVERMMNLRSCITGVATGDQGIFVRTALFKDLGGYPDIALMEDIALSKKLRHIARPACLRQRLVTSSRKWEQQGIFRTILLMWRLRLAYALGANPDILARRYYS
jgi:rSAM/selenodomain-associated transferase 2